MSLAHMDLAISQPALNRGFGQSRSNYVDPWVVWSFMGGMNELLSPSGLWSSIAELDAMSRLGDDWDGYGAEQISERATQYAADFLMAASAEDFPAPDVVPNSNGTITLAWQSAKNEAHLEIGSTEFLLSIDHGGLPLYISGEASELGRSLADFIAQSLYSQPAATATSIQFATTFRRAA